MTMWVYGGALQAAPPWVRSPAPLKAKPPKPASFVGPELGQ